MTTPDALEHRHTLRSAAARLDDLRVRAALGQLDDDAPAPAADLLEALSLSEVLTRKALHGRQLDVRAARAAGASWQQIGAALAVTRQAAWEAHDRWITGQARLHRDADHEGLTPDETAGARRLAGRPD